MTDAVGVAIVGCGSVSRHYLRMLRYFDVVRVLRCVDRHPDRARQRCESFGLGLPSTIESALADPAVAVVVNLTPPGAHAEVTEHALRAGKAVFSEKPLATTSRSAQRVVDLADQLGLPIACAPDTMLGRGIQTARDTVAADVIGTPVFASASVLLPGHESWHPEPAYYYEHDVGPLLDMGPYYLSALVHLLGPVAAVSAQHRVSDRSRMVQVGPNAGQPIQVQTPTTIAALLDFAHGALATLTCSFDAWATTSPNIEVHGTSGSMIVPDPNTFGGQVRVSMGSGQEWRCVPPREGYEVERGIGVADLAVALRSGRPACASADLALHVLRVIEAIFESAKRKTTVEVPHPEIKLERVPTDLSVYGWRGIPDPVDDYRLAELP